MTERPIIFSDAMSLAAVEGRKTETRRPVIINGAPARGAWWDHAGYKPSVRDGYVHWEHVDGSPIPGYATDVTPNPRLPCAPGDKLWVRECWNADREEPEVNYRAGGRSMRLCPSLSDADWASFYRWRIKCFGAVHRNVPSIHMPRWASRTTLDVLEVRVERLQSMSEEDALAEGCDPIPAHGKWALTPRHEGGHWSARPAFAAAWDAIYPAMPWASNPWVWVVRFKPIRVHATREEAKLEAIGDLLAENGCDCDCGHHPEEHDDDCKRCLACRVSAVVGPMTSGAMVAPTMADVIDIGGK